MRQYPKYKDSGIEGIGIIPEGWKGSKPKYKSLIKVRYGINISSDTYKDEGIRFIRITDISESGELNSDDPKFLNPSDVPREFILDKFDILLCRSGHTVGKSYFHEYDEDYTSGGYLVRFNFGDYELSKFFMYITKSDFYWDWIKLNTIISTIENVNGDKYSNFDFPLPPKEEFHQINRHLDEKTSLIDTLIQNKQRKIELLKEQRTAIINQTITKGLNPNVKMKDSGVEWIGEIPEHWKFVKIGYMSELLTGNPWKSELFNLEEGTKILRGDNVSEGYLRWGEKTRFWKNEIVKGETYFLKGGDIVVSMDGSKVGKNYVLIKDIDLPLLLHQRMCRIRVNPNLSSKYLTFHVGSDMFKYYIDIKKTDPMIPHITQKDIYNYSIPFPSLSEQHLIVEFLNDKTSTIDNTILLENKKIAVLKEYRQSLISEVVTGKIDVRIN